MASWSRYVVRRQDDAKYYCVWDRETDAVAVKADRKLSNLGFDEALGEAEKLNNPKPNLVHNRSDGP